MAQWPRASTALAGTLNLIPSIHSRQFTTVSNYRGSLARGGSILLTAHTYTHTHTYKRLQVGKWILFLKDTDTLTKGPLSHSVSPQQSWRLCVQDKGLESTPCVKPRDDWQYCPLTFNRLSNPIQAFRSRPLFPFSPYPELFTRNKSSLNKCSEFILMNTLQNLNKLFLK